MSATPVATETNAVGPAVGAEAVILTLQIRGVRAGQKVLIIATGGAENDATLGRLDIRIRRDGVAGTLLPAHRTTGQNITLAASEFQDFSHATVDNPITDDPTYVVTGQKGAGLGVVTINTAKLSIHPLS